MLNLIRLCLIIRIVIANLDLFDSIFYLVFRSFWLPFLHQQILLGQLFYRGLNTLTKNPRECPHVAEQEVQASRYQPSKYQGEQYEDQHWQQYDDFDNL